MSLLFVPDDNREQRDIYETLGGGTFNTYISELRRNGLIIISNDGIRVSEEFFK